MSFFVYLKENTNVAFHIFKLFNLDGNQIFTNSKNSKFNLLDRHFSSHMILQKSR